MQSSPKGESLPSQVSKFLKFNHYPKELLEYLDREEISYTVLESEQAQHYVLKDIDQELFKKAFSYIRRNYFKDG